MSGSAYPPGVTGHEPEIAGQHESEEQVQCRREEAVVLYRAQVMELIESARARAERYGQEIYSRPALNRLEDDLRDLPEAVAPCDWSGVVDVVWSDRTVFTWTCPQCGSDWEDEVD